MTHANSDYGPPPYNFVAFSEESPPKKIPPGHYKYLPDHLHGTLYLQLEVKTSLHIANGSVVMGSEVGKKIFYY